MDSIHYFLEDTSIGISHAAEEALTLLESGLVRLRPDERLVITLLELEEKSIREIAEMTGWSQANVKVRAFRARKKLKQLLEKQYEK